MQTAVPGIRLNSTIGKIVFNMSDNHIGVLLPLFLEINNHIQNQFPNNKGISENEELSELKAFKDDLKEIGDIISFSVDLIFKEMQLNIIENSTILTRMTISDVDLKLKTNKFGDIDGEFILEKFLIDDMRPGVKFSNIISNPLDYYKEEDTDEYTEAYDNLTQAKIVLHYKPRNDQVDIGIKLNEIRFIASADFVSSILKFVEKQIGLIESIVEPSAKQKLDLKAVSTTTTEFHTRITILFSNLEL